MQERTEDWLASVQRLSSTSSSSSKRWSSNADDSGVPHAYARTYGEHDALVRAAMRTVTLRAPEFDEALRCAAYADARRTAASIERACAIIAQHARQAAVERYGYAQRIVDAALGRVPSEHDMLAYYSNVVVDVRQRLRAAEPPPVIKPRALRLSSSSSSSREHSPNTIQTPSSQGSPHDPVLASSSSPSNSRVALRSSSGHSPLLATSSSPTTLTSSPTTTMGSRAPSAGCEAAYEQRDAQSPVVRALDDAAAIAVELGEVESLMTAVASFVDDQGRAVDRLDRATLGADDRTARAGRYLIDYARRQRASTSFACECVPLSRAAAIRCTTFALALSSLSLLLALA